jgi:cytochrome c oxidase assembly factor CtaG
MRMLELFAGMPFHAFFGIALMMASTPMVGTYTHPAHLPSARLAAVRGPPGELRAAEPGR